MFRRFIYCFALLALISLALPLPTQAESTIADTTKLEQAGVSATIKIANLNVRRAPRTTASVIGKLKLDEVVPVVGRDRLGSWIEILSPFGKGWINTQYILLTDDLLKLPITNVAPHIIVIANPYAHVRTGPFRSYPILTRIPYGADLDIVGRHSQDTMVQVLLDDGTVGWVDSELVQIVGDLTYIPFTDRTVLSLGEIISYRVRVRSAPNPNGTVIATVGLGEKYTIQGISANGWYFLISGPFGTGWVFSDYLRVLGYTSVIPVID
jgi:uncharacterized protein YgiM (DUF1202 family)